MTQPGYRAAHAAAPLIHRHFARHAGTVVASIDGLPVAPAIGAIEAVIDACFWASLLREELYVPRISLALVPKASARQPLVFDTPLPLTPATLAKIAPAVERPGNHLAVWSDHDEFRIWGTTRGVPPLTLVLEVEAPGLLVVKHHRADRAKFVNVAVLQGDRVKIVDEGASTLPDAPAVLSSLLGRDAPGSQNTLVRLAVSMRAHGRGGSLLVVPSETDAWRESILHPIPYSVTPPFTGLAEGRAPSSIVVDGALEKSIARVAGLTAVDGAVITTDRYDVLAFGAKIGRRKGAPLVERVLVTEPIEDGERSVVHPNHLGGTRHLSAAQFVCDQRDALAMVASQDGRFTMFAWSSSEDIVHAHRIEALLL